MYIYNFINNVGIKFDTSQINLTAFRACDNFVCFSYRRKKKYYETIKNRID